MEPKLHPLTLILEGGITPKDQKTLIETIVKSIGLSPNPEVVTAEDGRGTFYTWEVGCLTMREQVRNRIFYLLKDSPLCEGKSWFVGYQ